MKGPYAVGVESLHLVDPSRPSWEARGESVGADGNLRGRRIHVSIWYPAANAAGATAGTLGEYVFAEDPAWATGSLNTVERLATESRLSEEFRRRLDVAPGVSEQLLALRYEALRNAPWENGRFPVLLSATDFGTERSEFLASHGYVVVVAESREGLNLDDAVRDLELAIYALAPRAAFDLNEVGAVGFSSSGAVASLLQMKSPLIDVVVSIDGMEGFDTWKTRIVGLPYFAPERASVPYLWFHRPVPGADTSYFYDQARYMNLLQLEIKGLEHMDLSSDGLLSCLVPGYREEPPTDCSWLRRAHKFISEVTLQFLDAHLKRGESARRYLAALPASAGPEDPRIAIHRRVGLTAPPTRGELRVLFESSGAERLVEVVEAVRARDPQAYSADLFARMGATYLWEGDTDHAISLIELSLVKEPSACQAIYFRGLIHAQSGQHREAKARFEEFLAESNGEDPNCSSLPAWYRRESEQWLRKNLSGEAPSALGDRR